MQDKRLELHGKCALVTGGARRIGAALVRTLHADGMNLVVHYRGSADGARALQQELEAIRPDSVHIVQADLLDTAALTPLVDAAAARWGRLDVLVNNASTFYPTAVGEITPEHWEDLMGTNLRAPLFLSQAAAPHLLKQQGCIVNMADIHAERPLKAHPVYCSAKAGLVMLTRSLARELGPGVRVNAIAPGAILWPEDMGEDMREKILARVPMKRAGEPDDIVRAIRFLIAEADYITGQILPVDGGRSLSY